jgi:hypothetical protein
VKKYIYICLRGGLGNQLFSLCAGSVIANETRCNLLVDFRNISARSSSIKDFDILWDKLDTKIKYGNSRDKTLMGLLLLQVRIFYKIFAKMKKNFSYFPRSTSEVDERENIKSERPLLLDAHYENLIFPKMVSLMSSKFSITLAHETPNFMRFKEFLAESPVIQIGVHVRKGDFVTWQSGSQLLPTSYYKNAIEKATLEIHEYKIWIFTDESDSVEEILNLDVNAAKFSSVFALSDSEELIALGSMNKLIISRSTYSQWGALISYGDVYFPSGSQSLEEWTEVAID